MPDTIMQLNSKYDMSTGDYIQAIAPLAEQIGAVSGLRWKIWMINRDEGEAGGNYMLEDAEHLDSFLESELVSRITNHPAPRDFSIKSFEVVEDETAVTRVSGQEV